MKKSIIFSYFGFKLKNVLSDCFLISHVYIYMGEWIAGKQDRFSLIIEDPLRAPKIPPKYIFFLTFWPINEKMVFKLFPLVVHMFPL